MGVSQITVVRRWQAHAAFLANDLSGLAEPFDNFGRGPMLTDTEMENQYREVYKRAAAKDTSAEVNLVCFTNPKLWHCQVLIPAFLLNTAEITLICLATHQVQRASIGDGHGVQAH